MTTKEENQKKIGLLIKSLRESKGLTQKDFAKMLKTSQSAVARMEHGGQNFTTQEITKISNVLNRKIISIDDSMDFEIEGGRKLKGSVDVNTSKNGSLALMATSLLNDGTTIIRDIPKIEEINRLIELFEAIGVNIRWIDGNSLEIKKPEKIKIKNLLNESARKIRSGLMLIGPLLHIEDEFKLPHAGGCKMGQRTIAAHKYAVEEFGAKVVTNADDYLISKKKLKPADIVMYEMSDTATINALLTAAKIPGETVIRFASANYQVQDVCFMLEKMGVKVDGIGTTIMTVHGKSEINQKIEHHVSEDPTEAMFWLASGIVTGSEFEIKRCPIDFLSLELLKLEKMGLKYTKTEKYKSKNERTDLVDLKLKPSKLKAPQDKIHAQPYPGINTDNLPFFATIATLAEGTTLIHDWMWENRAIYFTELNRLGAQVDLADPHRVFVTGPSNLKAAQIVCPPALRPATIILVAMLAAPGKSVLRNVYSIRRGYEDVAERLNKAGAKIKVVKAF
ncbi:UDP-N-acetylglucosamine 1-carboxyvinyltransferase [Candidatus Parcubacteria bacterium]|nr:UDP-N-acetylglucosamine 1-carboxyvinyltransferase [Candidatus Parcubacteria bacterium]